VKLRYFAGLTIRQAADVLNISEPTAKRHWAYAARGFIAKFRATPHCCDLFICFLASALDGHIVLK